MKYFKKNVSIWETDINFYTNNIGGYYMKLNSENDNKDMISEKELNQKKVGGWLLFFCISITILAPLRTVYNIFVNYSNSIQMADFFKLYPEISTLNNWDLITQILVRLFGIYAGVSLWKVKFGALKIVKKYLIINLSVSAILCFGFFIFLSSMTNLPPLILDLIKRNTIRNSSIALIYFVTWYLYFKRSKRVNNTYKENF
jgi:hypothetical protein